MPQKNHYKEEILKYYSEAQSEYTAGHYHLVVGNLNYILHLLEQDQSKNDALYGEIYQLLCRTYINLKNYNKADEICEKGYLFHFDKDRYKVCYFWNQRVLIYMKQKKYSKVIYWCNQILKNLDGWLTEEEIKIKATAIYNLANCYLNQYKLEEAKKNYIKVYNFIRQHQIKFLKGKIFLGLGYVFHLQEKLIYAERCYLQGKKHLSPITDLISFGRLMHNLGEICYSRGQKEKAREYFLASLENEKVYKIDRSRVASSLRGMASTYLDVDISKVHYYCTQALNIILDSVGTKLGSAEEQELGLIFLLFGHWLKHQNNKDCQVYLKQAETIFKKYNLRSGLDEIEKLRFHTD